MTSGPSAPDRATSETDREAIATTIADYYLGWYDGDGERMARALHPALAKRGWLHGDGGGHRLTESTFASMVDGARAGHGRQAEPDVRRYETRAVEVHDDIASACVYAVPYVDYLHLVRTDAGWRIINALWRKP